MKTFLLKLIKDNIHVQLVDGDLSVKIPKEGVDTSIINEIKDRKEELIAYLMHLNDEDYSHAIKIPKLPKKEHYPLSNAQQRLWILDHMESGSATYHIFTNIELKGIYKFELFQKAITAVVERHEILRTVFNESKSGEVRQFVLEPSEVKPVLQYLDVRSSQDPQSKCKEFIVEDSYKPYNLKGGPLLRVFLIHLAEDNYVFYLNMHHIISDGWSLEIFARDVLSYYTKFESAVEPLLPELKIQYKDYSDWQLKQLEEPKYNIHEKYWIERLSGQIPRVDLPSDKVRPKVKTNNGRLLSTYLPSELSRLMRKFVEQQEGSLFMLIVALVTVLLSRYTGLKDVAVASPVAGRNHPDLEDQIGFYINVLVLRNQLLPNQNFIEFFNNVKENILKDFEHQEYPFDKLVDSLSLEYNPGRTLLYDISITFNENNSNVTAPTINPGDINNIKDKGLAACKNDIEFHFMPISDTMSMEIIFNSDVYDIKMITGLMNHFVELAGRILKVPKHQVDTVKFITEAEQSEIRTSFNSQKQAFPNATTLTDAFDAQVERSPEMIAVVYKNESLTYSELDARSNQFANCLISQYNISKGDIVAVQLTRTPSIIVALLGILKCGAAFVSIDPELPANRKEHIVNDTNTEVLITETSFIFDTTFFEGEIFAIDVEFEPLNYSDRSPEALNIHANDLAYIIYTSGSTGEPKGVMIEHGAILNTILSQITSFSIDVSTNVLQFASFSFDASIWETFISLLSGATLYMIDEDQKKQSDLLEDFINDHAIDFATLPPSYFNLLKASNLQNLKTLVTAGELPSAEKIKGFLPFGDYYNAYGPTETSICATTFKIEKGDDVANHLIPIGKPIANAEVLILDTHGHLVPKGVIGELCIAGKGLARGYLNAPKLTEEKFIVHPFNTSEKIYRTGDLGRWLYDGNIEFTGRKDDQVKIRGHRVELKEIEHQLLKKKGIAEVVVLAKDNEQGGKELVAYLISEAELSTGDLNKYLLERIPQYMIPSQYIQIDEVPLSLTGKIDKKELLKLEDGIVSSVVEMLTPEDDLEQNILEIWKKLLSLNTLSVLDNFFDIGGNSLKVTRLVSEYNKIFEVKIEFKSLFENRTLRSHASLIRASETVNFASIQPIEKANSYELSDAQKRMWVLSQFEGESIAYNIFNTFKFDKELRLPNFRKALAALIQRHEILRTVFKTDEDEVVRQYVLPADFFAPEIFFQDLRGHSDAADFIKDFEQKDSRTPFNLEVAPLFRMAVFQLSENECMMYYNMHHIISDEWSMKVLVNDVHHFYDAFNKGLAPNLPELDIQYKDYAAWQLVKTTEANDNVDKNYWMSKLSGELAVIDLPSEKKRPEVKTNNGSSVSCTIDVASTTLIKEFVQKEGGSLFIALMASWNVLLHRYTSQQDILIGTPVSGRDHSDLENQIGFYVNTIVLGNTVNENDEFGNLYKDITKNIIEAYNHQTYPFDRLVEDLNLKRDTSRSPIFDVMLVFQNYEAYDADGNSDELAVKEIFEESEIAKFDLEITFQELKDSLNLKLTFNSDVYDHSMILKLIGHYKNLIDILFQKPEAKIGAISFIDTSEKKELIEVFSQPFGIKTHYSTVIDLFLKQTYKTPKSTAVSFNNKSITYEELDALSNQMANYLLVSQNLKKGEYVGLLMDRSEWVLVSVLGVLKAGGAYIFMEPELPISRQEFIVNDAGIKTLISHKKYASDLSHFEGSLILTDDGLNLSQLDSSRLSSMVSAKDLAYVLYTSGSSGNPKGVKIRHLSLYNYLTWAREFYAEESFNCGLFTSLSFDLTITSLFLPIVSGGKLHIFPPQEDIRQILKMYFEGDHNTIKITPSHIDIIKTLNLHSNHVNTVIVGGDFLLEDHVMTLRSINPNTRVFNEYGPTEATVGCIVHEVIANNDTIIGKPINNTEAYILNGLGELQPKGVSGEICISGAGLSVGYLNRDSLTKEKFIPHPFKKDVKIYKTGDLGKWLSDGTLDYLGRIDEQVKILGYRIELGEIEQQILQKKGLKKAVVLAKKGSDKTLELIAYIVSDNKENSTEIREFLLSRIPFYMMPSKYVQLDAIPLTVNAKINKKKLLELDEPALSGDSQYQSATNDTEKKLVEIFAQILDRKESEIGTNDNFFDLGFNSLKLIKTLTHINRELNTDIKIVFLFQYPTIRQFVIALDQNMETEPENETAIDLAEELEDMIDLIEE